MILISSTNTLTATSRLVFDEATRQHWLAELTQKLTIIVLKRKPLPSFMPRDVVERIWYSEWEKHEFKIHIFHFQDILGQVENSLHLRFVIHKKCVHQLVFFLLQDTENKGAIHWLKWLRISELDWIQCLVWCRLHMTMWRLRISFLSHLCALLLHSHSGTLPVVANHF
jgi:hypothetical protein